jgi:cbb3-type cytochrome oxidase maturation protein
MESLFLLVPLSVALVLLIGWVFWRALQGGQFDDLERHGHSILETGEAEQGRVLDLNQDSRPPRP